MKVTFAQFGQDIASSRLRAAIPQQELKKYGVKRGSDVLVYGKHLLGFDQIQGFGHYVYDICDNHFDTPELRDYYYAHAERADLLTCNSLEMQRIIRERVGRDSVVIPEPYESDERKPCIGPMLYWFGHISNKPDLDRLMPKLGSRYKDLYLLTNPDWTRERHNKVMKHPLIVLLPTGKSMAKSENRMVEAIRQGKYACAEYLPAYEQFDKFFPLGDIPAHIEQALSDPEGSLRRIREAQAYVKDRFSPTTIGKKWLETLHGNFQSRRTGDGSSELPSPGGSELHHS